MLAILAKKGISFNILRVAPPDKVTVPAEPYFSKKTGTIIRRVREIVEYEKNKSKTNGITSVRKLKQKEFCDNKAV